MAPPEVPEHRSGNPEAILEYPWPLNLPAHTFVPCRQDGGSVGVLGHMGPLLGKPQECHNPRSKGGRRESCRHWIGKQGRVQCRAQPTAPLHYK